MELRPIGVGSKAIGPGYPCFIAAEAGINHNGDISLAHRLIDAAADAGVDGVKFQNYETEAFLSDQSLTYKYVSQGKDVVESQFEMFRRCELDPAAIEKLADHCRERNVIFFSTPTSAKGVDVLVKSGALLLKNGSDFLGHLPLIRAMAETGLPTVLSTGMATLGEIDDAVRAFRGAGGKDLILLHCTSSYPAPASDVHLRKIPSLSAALGCLVGFSDHTEGTVAAVSSIVLGSCFIEKHFTLDRGLPGPDHRFSSDPGEMSALVRSVRYAEQALGRSDVGPAPSETIGRGGFRLSCVAARDLAEGQILGAGDIAFRRPGNGLPPRDVGILLGRRLQTALSKGSIIQIRDI